MSQPSDQEPYADAIRAATNGTRPRTHSDLRPIWSRDQTQVIQPEPVREVSRLIARAERACGPLFDHFGPIAGE